MNASAVCTPCTGETSSCEVPRPPLVVTRLASLARLAAGRSSIEALGPGAERPRAPLLTREPLPRTGPGALCVPGPGPRDVVLEFFVRTLPAQAQLPDERAVALNVRAGQVLQQPAAAADQQQQAATAVVVMLVHLEVLGKVIDSPGQQRDLDFRRTGVTLTCRVLGDELLLHGCFQRHVAFLSLYLITGGAYGDRSCPGPPASRLRVQLTWPAMPTTHHGITGGPPVWYRRVPPPGPPALLAEH